MAEQKAAPVCVVTGGTSGVGHAVVRLFCDEGYRMATCGRDQLRIDQVREEILHSLDKHLVSQIDLSDIHQTSIFSDSILDKYGHVDVLVNNAASAPLGPFEDIDMDTFEMTLNTNIKSMFLLTQRVWRAMKQRGSGVIVNISSLAAVDPFPGFSIYGASKAWLDLMTVALASEGKEHGIRVCSIRAGAIETPLLRKLFPDFPADQCVSPESVAQTVFDCVNNSNRFESGRHFVVTNQS